MSLTKHDIKGLLTEQKKDLVQEMDRRFDAKEKRLGQRIAGMQKRLKETEGNLRQEIQQETRRQDKLFETLFTNILKYELGKQNDWMARVFGSFEHQLHKTHTAVTHVLGEQADLAARVEKLERQAPAPL